MEPHVLDGTWEEIRAYASRLAGHRVRVTILDPDAAPTAQIEAQFTALAARWRAETAWTSSVSQMIMHPAYQTIIGMGRDVIPCLLRALEHQPDHWFWALRAIKRLQEKTLGVLKIAGTLLRWRNPGCNGGNNTGITGERPPRNDLSPPRGDGLPHHQSTIVILQLYCLVCP